MELYIHKFFFRNGLVESFVSIKRISELLALSKMDPESFFSQMDEIVDEEKIDKAVVGMSKAIFAHTPETVLEENDFRLDKLDCYVKKGELMGVIGKVGSGKSSLLSSILGEMTKVSGKIAVQVKSFVKFCHIRSAGFSLNQFSLIFF